MRSFRGSRLAIRLYERGARRGSRILFVGLNTVPGLVGVRVSKPRGSLTLPAQAYYVMAGSLSVKGKLAKILEAIGLGAIAIAVRASPISGSRQAEKVSASKSTVSRISFKASSSGVARRTK